MNKRKLVLLITVLSVFTCTALGSGSSEKPEKASRSTSKAEEETNSEESASEEVIPEEAIEDTPEDQLKDLAIGESVTIKGITVTVNSVTDTKTSTGLPAYEVSVTYYNHSGSLLTITPYDWTTVLHTGSDKAYVGGDVSFNLDNLSDGEEWTGIVTLWNDDNTEKIKFESSSINMLEGKKLSATWILPNNDQTDSDGSSSLEDSSIELISGETGEYGKELILNKGTEFEDKTIGYFVDAGEYEVTNIGEKMTQVNVYKNETEVVDGWEQWADGNVELIDVNETKNMTVEDGYFFNIDPPAHIKIKKIK